MRRTFRRKGVPLTGVTDNGTLNITRRARLVEIDLLPTCIYRSLTSRVQRLSGKLREDIEQRRQSDDPDVFPKP